MAKQRTKYRKKRPKVFMVSKTISAPTDTSSKRSTPKTPTASKKKLSFATPDPEVPVQAPESADVSDRQLQGLRLLDMAKVSSVIVNSLSCSACKTQTLTVGESFAGRRGLVTDLFISCLNCSRKYSLSSPYDSQAKTLNRRSVLAMRVAGRGLASLEKFCGIMGLPPPVTDPAFRAHKADIAAAATEESVESRKVAAKELHRMQGAGDDDIIDVTVTFDGTWAKRGFTSQFGIVLVLSWETGQVLDYEVLSKYCHECKLHEGIDQSSSDFQDWWEGHEGNCSVNFVGSSTAMESEGALIIWKRSIENLNLRYTHYISDGDSKTYNVLETNDPYGVPIVKHDCVGHVQKRMGSRLRKRKQEGYFSSAKRKKVSLGGKGRLTEALIDSFQNYYGAAIRRNAGDVKLMKKAVLAIYYHSISTDAKPQHQYCPKGLTSWCKYQQAVAKRKTRSFTHKKAIPPDVAEAIRDIFLDLADEKLLERCLLAATQNQNEAIHHLIWSLCSKTEFQSKETIELSVALAVSWWNNGASSLLRILKRLNIEPGNLTEEFVQRTDKKRLKKAELREAEKAKEARKRRRRSKKKKLDTVVQKEGITYAPGGF